MTSYLVQVKYMARIINKPSINISSFLLNSLITFVIVVFVTFEYLYLDGKIDVGRTRSYDGWQSDVRFWLNDLARPLKPLRAVRPCNGAVKTLISMRDKAVK